MSLRLGIYDKGARREPKHEEQEGKIMVFVAERASDAGTYQPNTIKAAPMLHGTEYAARHRSQGEKSAFLQTIIGRRGSLRPILSQAKR